MIRPLPKPFTEYSPHRKRLLEAVKDRSMSYIAALCCIEGVVLVADTQETYGDHKQYAEKLAISEDRSYPLALGGAGVDEITESFSQELLERVTALKPPTARELRKIIKGAIDEVYQTDLVVSALPKQYRTAEFLVAAKPANDEFALFRLKGKRVYPINQPYAIVGYATAANKALLKRMYREGLSMHRAVLLANYLVSQSKATDEGVGGETRIALVAENGASLDERDYIGNVEKRAHEFLSITDTMFLECADLTTNDSKFSRRLDEYKKQILDLRNKHKRITSEWFFSHPQRIATYNSPYPYLSPGFVLTLMGNGTTSFSEDDEKLRRVREIVANAQSHPYFFKCECGAEIEYMLAPSSGGTAITANVGQARDIAISSLTGTRRVLGQIQCPDCKRMRKTPAQVIRYRKIGDAAWIELPSPSS